MRSIQKLLIVSALFGLFVCVLGMMGCPTPPNPSPVPGPTPSYDAAPVVGDAAPECNPDGPPADVLPPLPDTFIMATIDCGTVGVKRSLATARPPVESCLEQTLLTEARQCLLRFMPTWSMDSVVCAVRSVGMSAFKAEAAKVASPSLLANAAMSRQFIVAEKFSIRN